MTELKKYKMFIGGEWVDSDTKKTFVCYSRWGSGSNEYETSEIKQP